MAFPEIELCHYCIKGNHEKCNDWSRGTKCKCAQWGHDFTTTNGGYMMSSTPFEVGVYAVHDELERRRLLA